VQVKWATSDKLSKKVALKIISKKKAPMDFQQKFLPRELDVMKLLDHPHIVKMYDILYINDKVRIINTYKYKCRLRCHRCPSVCLHVCHTPLLCQNG